MKMFPCKMFGDYSGYEKTTWKMRTHDSHLQQVSMFRNAKTASDQQKCEKKFGVRYSDLLRLPYFNIVEYHVVDPMHNLLLGTANYLMTIWKDEEVLTKAQFDYLQQEHVSLTWTWSSTYCCPKEWVNVCDLAGVG